VATIAPEQVEQPTQAPVLSGCEIASSYDWDYRTAYAVCMAESSGDSNAVGDNYAIAGLHAPSCGLMQIRTLKGRPSCEELKDPKTNMDWAYKISNNGTNFNPWTVYTNGKYLKYL
jgi:hypothetical protein